MKPPSDLPLFDADELGLRLSAAASAMFEQVKDEASAHSRLVVDSEPVTELVRAGLVQRIPIGPRWFLCRSAAGRQHARDRAAQARPPTPNPTSGGTPS